MSNILYTAFNGRTNSSKVLLDNINVNEKDKLYLKNSFLTSVIQLEKKIIDNNYDLIISFGQCPLKSNTIKLEKNGKYGKTILTTDYNLYVLKKKLEENNFQVIVSEDAGNYLCNNIYYNGLKIIKDKDLKCLMVFIHIPELKNIDDIKALAKLIY